MANTPPDTGSVWDWLHEPYFSPSDQSWRFPGFVSWWDDPAALRADQTVRANPPPPPPPPVPGSAMAALRGVFADRGSDPSGGTGLSGGPMGGNQQVDPNAAQVNADAAAAGIPGYNTLSGTWDALTNSLSNGPTTRDILTGVAGLAPGPAGIAAGPLAGLAYDAYNTSNIARNQNAYDFATQVRGLTPAQSAAYTDIQQGVTPGPQDNFDPASLPGYGERPGQMTAGGLPIGSAPPGQTGYNSVSNPANYGPGRVHDVNAVNPTAPNTTPSPSQPWGGIFGNIDLPSTAPAQPAAPTAPGPTQPWGGIFGNIDLPTPPAGRQVASVPGATDIPDVAPEKPANDAFGDLSPQDKTNPSPDNPNDSSRSGGDKPSGGGATDTPGGGKGTGGAPDNQSGPGAETGTGGAGAGAGAGAGSGNTDNSGAPDTSHEAAHDTDRGGDNQGGGDNAPHARGGPISWHNRVPGTGNPHNGGDNEVITAQHGEFMVPRWAVDGIRRGDPGSALAVLHGIRAGQPPAPSDSGQYEGQPGNDFANVPRAFGGPITAADRVMPAPPVPRPTPFPPRAGIGTPAAGTAPRFNPIPGMMPGRAGPHVPLATGGPVTGANRFPARVGGSPLDLDRDPPQFPDVAIPTSTYSPASRARVPGPGLDDLRAPVRDLLAGSDQVMARRPADRSAAGSGRPALAMPGRPGAALPGSALAALRGVRARPAASGSAMAALSRMRLSRSEMPRR